MVVLTELASPNDVMHFAVAGKVLGAFRMGTNLQYKIKLKYDLIHLKASGINVLKEKERSEIRRSVRRSESDGKRLRRTTEGCS